MVRLEIACVFVGQVCLTISLDYARLCDTIFCISQCVFDGRISLRILIEQISLCGAVSCILQVSDKCYLLDCSTNCLGVFVLDVCQGDEIYIDKRKGQH